jgi:hypothetical protein
MIRRIDEQRKVESPSRARLHLSSSSQQRIVEFILVDGDSTHT